MLGTCYRTSAIYRKFDEELLAVQLKTGYFFYFSSNTKTLLDFFSEPRTFEDYLHAASITETDREERSYLESFLEFLVENQLIEKSPTFRKERPCDIKYSRPVLLRRSDRRIEKVPSSF